jgi:hypothetical protein
MRDGRCEESGISEVVTQLLLNVTGQIIFRPSGFLALVFGHIVKSDIFLPAGDPVAGAVNKSSNCFGSHIKSMFRPS